MLQEPIFSLYMDEEVKQKCRDFITNPRYKKGFDNKIKKRDWKVYSFTTLSDVLKSSSDKRFQ